MVTAPPEPVYPVTVMAPPLVWQVNCACATVGSANTSSDSSLAVKEVLNLPVVLSVLAVCLED